MLLHELDRSLRMGYGQTPGCNVREVQKPMEDTDAASQVSRIRTRRPRNGVVQPGDERAETAAMTPVVELIAARKRYGAIEALQGVDLCIRPGEVVALLGPNGAGKTTTISLMLGLRRPTSGRALLFGLTPTDRRARSRAGVMLQESGVMGVLTVRETVRLFRSYYPQPLPLGETLALAGLEEVADQRVMRLSGGQRQRLYFALAICGDPEAALPRRAHRGHGRRGTARLPRWYAHGLQRWQDDCADDPLPGGGRRPR